MSFTFPGTPAALYSLRLVGSGYAGNCVKVLRISDNATQNIGFVSGLVDMTSALAFAAGSQLYVDMWYDQSGNGLDLTTVTNQPQLNVLDGLPWISFQGNGDPYLASATAPTLTGDQTVGMVGVNMCAQSAIPVSQYDGSNGWFLWLNGTTGTSGSDGPHPGAVAIFSTGGGSTSVQDTTNYMGHGNRYVAKRSSGTGTVYINGTQTATGTLTNNSASTGVLTIGAFNTLGYPFAGLISEVFIYSTALSDTDRIAIDKSQNLFWADPGFGVVYGGGGASANISINATQSIVCGNVVDYERTASWTVSCAVQQWFVPNTAGCVYTTVPPSGPAYPGHELWIDQSGKMRVRIIHDIGANNFIGLVGSTNLVDGKKHMLAYSYDGSSTAAGVKMYVDGILDTPTVEADTLSATIIGSGQSLYLGTQQGLLSLSIYGTLSHFQIDNVARSGAYIAAHSVPSSLFPIDGNTDIALALTDGSGTTATDSSGNSRNGTLADANMWLNGYAYPDFTSFSATEARDAAAFTATDKDNASFAPTEARDTAAFTATDKDKFSLAATEARDTASFTQGATSDPASLSVTEARDAASFSASGATPHYHLAVTEAQDEAAVSVFISDTFVIAKAWVYPNVSGQAFFTTGQRAIFSCSFVNQSDLSVDAFNLVLTIQPPSGPAEQISSGFLIPMVGVYEHIQSLNMTGTWTYQWTASGLFTASASGSFDVPL